MTETSKPAEIGGNDVGGLAAAQLRSVTGAALINWGIPIRARIAAGSSPVERRRPFGGMNL